MSSWQFILIAIILMKRNFCVVMSHGNLGFNESMGIEKRLPEDVIPKKYVIVISPNFVNDGFHGFVRIDVELQKARNYIVLHSKDLTVTSTKLYSRKTRAEVQLKSVFPAKKREMLIIQFYRKVPSGKYFLKMNFTGSLKGKITGFYLSTYVDKNKSIRKLAVTQFEPTYARSAFPCFDEPSFKSIFVVSIIHRKKSYHAMSNMPIAKVEKMKNGRDTITLFKPTPPMSTYLVAFVISDFECLGSHLYLLSGRQIPLTICTRPMYRNKTKFALNVAVRAMQYYLTVFQIEYPLPKLDLVAIPDFAAGAMENWGLVTFRETELLHNENSSSCWNTKRVSLTVAHELAHMWFGNLVTMKWWNDLWLNEGFATYMEYRAVDSLFPEWNLMHSFPIYTKYVSMKHDSKLRARPIVKRVENPEEIEELFDRISYQKAASVIKMLEDAIGNSKFIGAIRYYLQKHRFRNTESRELFEILQNGTRIAIDVADFMTRWTKFPGFPVINVRQDGTIFQLSRRRFAISKKFQQTIDDGSWTIPIKYVTSRRDGVKLDWFLANFSCAELSVGRPVDWIKLNHDSIGYYIVNYTRDAWYAFSNLLSRDHRILSPMNRADLLHDAFLLAGGIELHYHVVMNLTSYLSNETEYQPWAVAAEWFERMNRLLGGTSVIDRFQSYGRSLVEKIYGEVGWRSRAGNTFADREFRVLILNAACSVGYNDCLETAGRKLKNFLWNKDGRPLPADIRSIVYSYGPVTMSQEAGSIFENMSQLLAKETDVQERERLMVGLTSFQNRDILNRYLEKAMDESFVRKQDFAGVLIKIASNPVGLDVVWTFVQLRLEDLVMKYETNEHILGKIVSTIVSLFIDRQKLQEARHFFMEHSDLKITETMKRNAIEEIENSINWLDANMQDIEEWLTANNYN
nr:PREDICTED: glutamyl aminopeptidase-like [Megachile rotundata]